LDRKTPEHRGGGFGGEPVAQNNMKTQICSYAGLTPLQIAIEHVGNSSNTGFWGLTPITPFVSFTGCSISGNPSTDIGLYSFDALNIPLDFTGISLAQIILAIP
jgi:hypothetical protein